MSLSKEEQVKRIQKIMNKPSIYPDGRFTFGTYKGKTIEQVMKKDPAYVDWALSEDFIGKQFRDKLEKAMKTWRDNGGYFKSRKQHDYSISNTIGY